MKQQICKCHKFHTGPCKVNTGIEDCCSEYVDKAKRIAPFNYVCIKCGKDVSLLWFLYQEAFIEKENPSYKLASDPIGSVWFNGIEYVPKKQYPEFRWKDFDGDKFWRKSILDKLPIKPKKPSILQQIKDFIGQIGCDLS